MQKYSLISHRINYWFITRRRRKRRIFLISSFAARGFRRSERGKEKEKCAKNHIKEPNDQLTFHYLPPPEGLLVQNLNAPWAFQLTSGAVGFLVLRLLLVAVALLLINNRGGGGFVVFSVISFGELRKDNGLWKAGGTACDHTCR